MTPEPHRRTPRPTPAFALTILLLVVGLVPLPKGSYSRWVRQTARSQEPNRADRDTSAAGYYEGLIDVGNSTAHGELAERLMGTQIEPMSFHDIGATRYMFADVLQFELKPGLCRTAFGLPFTTNALGMRDRVYNAEKPAGTYRIALLGSSIDMGWGVADDQTYENRLEDWLNSHAQRVESPRRFEVHNLAMAAYSPVHRLETYRRKARLLAPDLVIFSATMLDPRLVQIHLCGLLQDRAPLDGPYAYLAEAAARAGITPEDLRLASDGSLVNKRAVKEKIDGQLWEIIDETLGVLAAECRAAGTPLLCVIVPRAGESDTPAERGEGVDRYAGLIARHGIPQIDLTAAFDDEDPAAVSVAPHDDHPNAQGHKHLFRSLARAIVADQSLYRLLFGAEAVGRRPALEEAN